MSIKKLNVKIKGIVPLIMHNGQTKDPLNAFSKEIKSITAKKKKTDEDYKNLADIEWRAGIYVNEDKQLIIPGMNLEALVVEGAKKSKKGNEFKAGFFVEKDALLQHTGPKDISLMEKDPNYRLIVGVNVNGKSIMRNRPIFREWKLDFQADYYDDVLSLIDIKKALLDAGRLCGLGDWSPRFGRFLLEECKEV